ncbi:MAG TPA: TonB-dependent receptor [Bryobacteraceae bacterium]|nr:TonB-dependent receptor [Bryobacteraceae bacterium]
MQTTRKLTLLLATAMAVFAQSERGNITGIVTDPTGAAVASANLLVIHQDTNATTRLVATSKGEYNAANLPPGSYRIEVMAPGFKQLVRQNIGVAASTTVRVDAQLQLGQVSEQIEVSAAIATIQTDDAKVSTQVENKMVDELPLQVAGDMRSPFNLVAVVPEAQGAGQALSLGGGQVAAWDATLDGYSVGTNRSGDTAEAALNTPSLDALTEFTVDTNGFKAEYGQAGGGVMTFASKSGTNKFHGSTYDFLRNDVFDARGFFARTRSIYRQNDFGFTAAGPIWIPKVYNGRNKTFFFVSYEGFRNRVGANNTVLSIPTPEMYKGDFQYWVDPGNKLIPVYDPGTTRAQGSGFTRDVFPNNQIPANRISRTASAIANQTQFVLPNRGGVPGNRNYVTSNYLVPGGTLIRPTDKWSAKGDQLIGSKHRVSFLWNATSFENKPGPGGAPGLPEPLWNGQIQAWDTAAYRFSHDWTISPSMINHFSYARNTFTKNSYSANVDKNWKDKVCIKNVVDCNQNFPTINFTEFTVWGSTSYNGTDQPGWGIKNDLSYIRKSHTFKFGFQHQNQNANGFGQQDIGGRADFSFLSTSIPGLTTFPASGGSSFASFLIGDAILGRTETIRYVAQKYPYFGFYVQDDWRVTRKLIVNLGVRYDFTLPPVNAKDEYSDFNPTRPNPGADGRPGALWFAGFGPGRENTRSLVPGWYGGIGPRIGAAYSLNDRTTIRTGFGISYSRITAVQGSGHFAGFIGQYQFDNTSQGVQPTFKLDEGLPSYKLPPLIDPAFSNGNTVDWWQGQDATRAPENLSWTLSVQRQVSKNTVLDIGYNATVGTHLQSGILNYNQVPTATFNGLVAKFGATQALNILRADINSATAQNAGIGSPYPSFSSQQLRTVNQALRPFPQYSTISTGPQNGDKSGHSAYHALLVKANRRFSRDVTIQWSYLFSKLLTDSDTYFANSATAAQDQYNRRLEKSIGQYDRTHTFKFSTIYNLPFGRGQKWFTHGLLSQVIGGWRLAGIQVYNSGTPIALQRNNPLPIFNAITRPQVDGYENWRAPLAGDSFDPAKDRFLVPAGQFPSQPAASFGNATRYNPKVRAFWGASENLSLSKTFHVTETVRLDFRGEAFNLLNRVIFNPGSTNLNAINFGQVTSQANDPRSLQVALKIYW